MKRLFYLMLVVLSTVVFTACSDDEDNNNGGGNNNGEGVITVITEAEEVDFWVETFQVGESITIDWGDGKVSSITTIKDESEDDDRYSHVYSNKGSHVIKLTGNIIGFYNEDPMKTDVNVSKCPNLQELSLHYGSLSSLDLTQNKALASLNCCDNLVTSLDLSQCTELTYLNCSNTQLTSLDISNCTALTELECYQNQLISLDVSKNTALTKLYCGNNQLTSLDITQNTALTRLWCESNRLTSLDISKNTKLTELECNGNPFTSAEMNKIYEALPTVEKGILYCNELGNPDIAEQKGWEVHILTY